MQLLTQEIVERIPKLYQTENQIDPIVQIKLFYPDFSWTWYVIEFDGKDTFFGFVVGEFSELGYFSLRELEKNRGRFGLEIERDIHFIPTPLSEIKKLNN